MKRKRLPTRHECSRLCVKIGGRKLYVDVARDDDGGVRELFLDFGKTGSEPRAWAEVVSRCVSVMLQYGVPTEKVIRMLKGTKFEPRGIVVGDPRIRFASSPLDFVAKFLEAEEAAKDGYA